METRDGSLSPFLLKKQQPPLGTVTVVYALDNLFMKGTISIDGKLKAIIQTADGVLVNVTPGMHMGLNFGKVVRVAPDSVEVEEFISDGKGCWDKRNSRIDLITAE